MDIKDFDFELPAELIAQHPVTPRDHARLLCVAPGEMSDHRFHALPDWLRAGDVLVVNDTRVKPARLFIQEPRVELLVLSDGSQFQALARPAKRLRVGQSLSVSADLTLEVLGKRDGMVTLRTETPELLAEALERQGRMPLPPYIHRHRGAATEAWAEESRDREDYQTMFARHPGAVAAPTAGLHFTAELRERLGAMGVIIAPVTLHVGVGTFLPVRGDSLEAHVMPGESGIIPAGTAKALLEARRERRRIIAVGTTSLRLLEGAWCAEGGWGGEDFRGEVSLFIKPGYRFQVADGLITNFHLPRSTLFVLVAAFAGLEVMRAAYAHAIARGYRFYSYGDACLLWRHEVHA